MIEIGENIKIFRELKGYSQQGLADSIGVSQKTISRIECNQSSPSLEIINKICDEFEIELQTLIQFKGNLIMKVQNENSTPESPSSRQKEFEKLYTELIREKDRHIRALEKELNWLKNEKNTE